MKKFIAYSLLSVIGLSVLGQANESFQARVDIYSNAWIGYQLRIENRGYSPKNYFDYRVDWGGMLFLSNGNEFLRYHNHNGSGDFQYTTEFKKGGIRIPAGKKLMTGVLTTEGYITSANNQLELKGHGGTGKYRTYLNSHIVKMPYGSELRMGYAEDKEGFIRSKDNVLEIKGHGGNSTGRYVTYIADRLGIGTKSPQEALQIGDKLTLHSAGGSFIGSNWYWDSGASEDKCMNTANGSSRMLFDNSGNIFFQLKESSGGVSLSGYKTPLKINADGTITMNDKLTVKSEIEVVAINTQEVKAQKINLEMNDLADYVFDEAYELKSLTEVEQHINTHGHLPGVPSAKEVKENGMDIAQMNNILLEKVEELTLHLIALQKELDALK